MQEKRCPMPIDTRNEDRITESTGNVFTDLGFDDAEAQVLALRADLMALLAKQIKARRMTQVAAAKVLGVSQGRVSDLTRGKADKFSLDMLVTFAAKLRSEEHTSELQSLMRNSYAVFCLKIKKNNNATRC